MNKRGQFFLLAAIIIATVIIGLGVNPNRVITNKEPSNFYNLGHEVKREVGAVLDYRVYTGFDSAADIEEFVNLMAEDINTRSPGSNFVFIYGDNSEVKLKNCRISGNSSKICLEGSCQMVSSNSCKETTQNNPGDNVSIEVGGNYYEFPLTGYNQVIFVMEKDIGGDRHVVIE